ncbi:DUF2189 domain-containing protein [Inhella proteolytica]|uniref:DUF2189 domain-containing protein n=1 Tax=Inhella proteolytica TaxID=2795029 RepID=A0A931IXH5_9BURK|nr:DUF2189 domain-containing protein [Inhella proteolytica]MBH9575526.1 DUF2189 domain-containing protein [Inhella proteolytica]
MSPALVESLEIRLRPVQAGQIAGWLRRGWQDFCACPLAGLLHGAAMAAFGLALLALAGNRFWLLAGAFSGFLLVAPVAATGLYAISRARARGQPAGLAVALRMWIPNKPVLIGFGLLLALAGTGWVLTSAALITAFAPGPVDSPRDFLQLVVLAREGHLFELWMALGALLAAPVYASSVVSIPLLLDRRVGLWSAVLTSWRVVLAAPGVLGLWAALLVLLSLLAMLPLLLGLLVLAPWLAHASWHAYTELVDASALAERR